MKTVKMPSRRPLRLTITAPVGKSLVPALRRHLRQAHRLLDPPLAELSVVLVGDRRMSELHEQFMDIAGPTDVLTFPLDEDAGGQAISGEVVVCVPEARRNARERGIPLESEVLLYALHGMLHLCGFDDRTDTAYRHMHRKEDDILTQLGIGPVFATESRSRPARQRRRRATRSAGDARR